MCENVITQNYKRSITYNRTITFNRRIFAFLAKETKGFNVTDTTPIIHSTVLNSYHKSTVYFQEGLYSNQPRVHT